ncbi:uncharacterized protein LOC118443366 [Vespa mandarinia]|uniref:uncharacterized protein LOC118443366 n=1 Tax=Vespa mandarinia TaxID=7446 RepID=UPI001615336B|nr:uncharacterized protein LOC118443366 [Vespa mandarinia]XP_035726121.1 uncharacterized protein LOC118443366 [Vespa mandarinia]
MNVSSCYEIVVTSVIMDKQMLLLLIGLCTLRSVLGQSDLQIIIDNIDLKINEEYIQNCKMDPCETSDMVPTLTIDCQFVKEIPEEAVLHIVLYGMSNGEPTDPTGVDIEMSSCQMINDTMIMGPIIKAMKMSLKCPIPPTNVFLKCFSIPMDEFPDYFPSGEYNFNLLLDYKDVNLFAIDLYLTFY